MRLGKPDPDLAARYYAERKLMRRVGRETQRAIKENSGCYCVICLRAVPEAIFEARKGCCSAHTFDEPCQYGGTPPIHP